MVILFARRAWAPEHGEVITGGIRSHGLLCGPDNITLALPLECFGSSFLIYSRSYSLWWDLGPTWSLLGLSYLFLVTQALPRLSPAHPA